MTDRLERTAIDLAELVRQTQRLGVVDGWREYILDQARRSGVSNQQIKIELDRIKNEP